MTEAELAAIDERIGIRLRTLRAQGIPHHNVAWADLDDAQALLVEVRRLRAPWHVLVPVRAAPDPPLGFDPDDYPIV